MLRILAWGYGLRRIIPVSKSGSLMSSIYLVVPATFSIPSIGGILPPTIWVSILLLLFKVSLSRQFFFADGVLIYSSLKKMKDSFYP
jgi:hypothetical protein